MKEKETPAVGGGGEPGIPNAHGCLEYAAPHGVALVLRGWMVDHDGPFAAIVAEVDGAVVARAERISRPDLADPMPHMPDVTAAGFHFELPLALVDAAGRLEFRLVGQRAERAIAQMAGGWLRDGALPPPPHLMQRVAHTQLDYMFRAGGMKTAFDFVRAARRVRPRQDFARVLDWGCGSGRVTTHLATLLPGTEIVGADLDREAIEWAGREVRGATFVACGMEPPLPLPRASFDVVFAGSVFTHLTAALQTRWLAELRSLLRPGGLLVASTLGQFAASLRAYDRGLAGRLDAIGIDDATHDPTLDGVVAADYYRATWQSQDWTREHWGRQLRVRHVDTGGYENYQDLWVLQHAVD